MDKEKIEKVTKFIKKYYENYECPVCHKSEWVLGSHIYQMPEFFDNDMDKLFKKTSTFPVLPISCDECGYTVLVSAITCGAVSPDQEAEND